MKKTRFFAIFLAAFALLLVIWNVANGARWYTDGVLLVAGTLGPLLHGWVLEVPPPGQGRPVWMHGENHVQASIQFDALAIGVVPLLALLAATPEIRLATRVGRMLVGALINFMISALIVALFPLLVFYTNPFTDIIGTFLGLIAFVGAPAIIWFGLSFRELQGLLPQLRPHASTGRAS